MAWGYFFVRTGYFLQHEKYEADNVIKPQGAIIKIDIPDLRIENEESAEFVSPLTSFALEEIVYASLIYALTRTQR